MGLSSFLSGSVDNIPETPTPHVNQEVSGAEKNHDKVEESTSSSDGSFFNVIATPLSAVMPSSLINSAVGLAQLSNSEEGSGLLENILHVVSTMGISIVDWAIITVKDLGVQVVKLVIKVLISIAVKIFPELGIFLTAGNMLSTIGIDPGEITGGIIGGITTINNLTPDLKQLF